MSIETQTAEPTHHRGVELKSVGNIRQNPSGTWEARVKHPMLPSNGESITRDTRPLAAIAKLDRLAELDDLKLERDRKIVLMAASGASKKALEEVASQRAEQPAGKSPHLGWVIGRWLEKGKNLTHFARIQGARLQRRSTSGHLDVKVDKIDVRWGRKWVEGMQQARLTPVTIQSYVCNLRMALDWYLEDAYPKDDDRPVNPLWRLGNGYADYADPNGDGDTPENITRDRLLEEGEEQRIVDFINSSQRSANSKLRVQDKQSAVAFFYLLIWTGLRMREAYSIKFSDINLSRRTIWVGRSKTTKKNVVNSGAREVPIRPELLPILTAYLEHRGFNLKGAKPAFDRPIFPYWDMKVTDKMKLHYLSSHISRKFRHIFKDAGCVDLRVHDLRHEATTRWMKMTRANGDWMYRTKEVMAITGHTTEECFNRYFNIRGAELSDRMYEDEAPPPASSRPVLALVA